MGEASGRAAVEAVSELADGASAAEQLELLAPSSFPPGDARAERVRSAVSVHRRGRPPGAANLATRDVKDFCRKVFAFDPMVEGFRWAQHTPETLALELGCSKLEAFDRLEALRKDLTRYFYAPVQPVDEDGRPVPSFAMYFGGAGAAGQARPPWEDEPAKSLENKGSGDPAGDVSHGEQSHGIAK